MSIQTINPATERVLNIYEVVNDDQVRHLVDNAHEHFMTWKKTPFPERSKLLLIVAQNLRSNQERYANLMAEEMGKPIRDGRAEVEKCAWVCEHYAKQAETYLASRTMQTDMKKTMVCYQPLGVVLGIMPWNFPFWQVFRFAAPTIMAGNVVILKHASICAGVGNAIAELFIKSGFPSGVFQHILMNKETVASVIANEKVVGVTLTGSDETGRIVASAAGAHLKKSMLE